MKLFYALVITGVIAALVALYIHNTSCQYGDPYNCLDLVVPR